MEIPSGDAGCDGVELSLLLKPSGTSGREGLFVSLQHLGVSSHRTYSWAFVVGCRDGKLMGLGVVGKLL